MSVTSSRSVGLPSRFTLSPLTGTNPKAGVIDETPAAGGATSGLAEPFTLMKHKAARFATGWFHQQAIGSVMQTFPDMFEMRKNVFFRKSHQGGNIFG
jgi:hypothetical protein